MFRIILPIAIMMLSTESCYAEESADLKQTGHRHSSSGEHVKCRPGRPGPTGPEGPAGLNGQNGRNGAQGPIGPTGAPGPVITDVANYVFLQPSGASGAQAFTGVGNVTFNSVGVSSGTIIPLGTPVSAFQLPGGSNLYEVTYSVSLANPSGFVPAAQFVLNLDGTNLPYTTLTTAIINTLLPTTAIVQTFGGANVLSLKSLTIPDPTATPPQTNVFVGYPDGTGLSNLVGATISIVKLN
jgi:hypothetical protein